MTLLIPMDEFVKFVEEGFKSEKMKVLAQVEEGFESAKRNMITRFESFMKNGNQTSARTNMKLEFRNRIAQTILTGEEIKGEGGVPIEVALVNDSAGDVVDSGAEASADVEIVLLKAKSEGDEFIANIVPEVEGKKPILAGNIALQLQKGLGVVKNIKFRHHASKMKQSEFKLGARVVGDCCIKEAKSELFTLKDYRGKYIEKHDNPSLSDEVWRLDNIQRNGKIDKRLGDNKIYTVEDFLIQLLINPQGLKSLCEEHSNRIVGFQGKKWDAVVNNARACKSGERAYFYMDLEQKTGIVFNILGHVLGLCSGGYYYRTSTLSEEQKEKLLDSAYRNWEGVKPFKDENSLQQHLSCSGKSMDPSDSQKPECPGGGHENTGGSEMMGELSSRRSNIPCLSASSTVNLFGEAGGQDFGSFKAGDGNWQTIVTHAQTCIVDDKSMYSHKSSTEPQTAVVYDASGKLKGLIDESHFVPIDDPSADKMDHAHKLLRSVLEPSTFVERYKTLFDDEASLLQQFPCRSLDTNASSSQSIIASDIYDTGPSDSLASKGMGELRDHSLHVFPNPENIDGDTPTDLGTASLNNENLCFPTDKADGEELLASFNDVYYPQQQLNGTYEMVGESSSRCSNTSFLSVNSTLGDSWWCDDVNWRDVLPPSPNPMLYYADNTQMYGHRDDEALLTKELLSLRLLLIHPTVGKYDGSHSGKR